MTLWMKRFEQEMAGDRKASVGAGWWLVVAVALVWGGCERRPVAALPELRGIGMTGLVEGKDAPLFEAAAGSFIEAVWKDGAWHFHQGDVLLAADPLGTGSGVSRLVISAPGDAKAAEVADMVRRARMAGVSRIELLVRRASSASEPRALVLVARSSGAIEPMLIGVAADGGVSTGTGASQSAHPSLARLVPTLELFEAAARAAGSEPSALVVHRPEADYQRVVDAIGALAKFGIQADWLNAEPADPLAPRPGTLRPAPSSVPRGVAPLGLAPPDAVER